MQRIIWYPSEFLLHHQWRFHNLNMYRTRILVGGWASGKSLTTTIELINQLTIYQNLGFLGRYEIPELMQSVIQDIVFAYLNPEDYKHNVHRRTITFRKFKSSLIYGFLNPAKLKNKMLGGNFGVICVDQMEEIDEQTYEMLLGRLRRENTLRNFIANANPNGKDWIYRRFIENAEEQAIKPSKRYYEEIVKINPIIADLFTYETFPPYYEYHNIKESSVAIVIQTYHNPFIPKDYLISLQKLPQEVRERFVNAKFTEFSGKIYKEFDEKIHLYSAHRLYKDMEVYVAIDPAVQNITAVIFGAWDGKVLWIFDEIYEQSAYPKEIIRKIKDKLIKYEIDPDKVNYLIDIASKKQFIALGKTIYSDYAIINPVPKLVDKLKAILQVKMFFYNNKIMINKELKNTINEHTNYKWNRNSTREEPLKKDDHTVDCVQYIVDEIVMKHNVDLQNIETVQNNFEVEENNSILKLEDEFHERMNKLIEIRNSRRKIMKELRRNAGLVSSWRV